MSGLAIILDRPQMGENIGACARAMMNCGLSDLRLVAPRDGWPNAAATAMAAHAGSVIEGARVYASVAEATADLTQVYATTARPRDQVKRVLTARSFGVEAVQKIAQGGRVGVLFGKEATGLENDDIARANAVIRVPLNPENTSLNLGQACLLVGYEWYQAMVDAPQSILDGGTSELASKAQLDNFLDRLVAKLDASGFLGLEHKRPKMLRNIRNIFERAELTDQEIQTLFGVFSSLEQLDPPARPGDSYAVVFESLQTDDTDGYGAMVAAMVKAASDQPGFQRVVAARNPAELGGQGITVSYWDSLEAIKNWGQNAAHKVAQRRGNAQWYAHWVLTTLRAVSVRKGPNRPE